MSDMPCGSMFYLLMFSKLILKIFGTIFDVIENILKKIDLFIKKMIGKIKFDRKNKEIKQDF